MMPDLCHARSPAGTSSYLKQVDDVARLRELDTSRQTIRTINTEPIFNSRSSSNMAKHAAKTCVQTTVDCFQFHALLACPNAT